MDTTTRTASPLRQRLLDDMRMRKLEPRTQEGYIRAVRKLTVSSPSLVLSMKSTNRSARCQLPRYCLGEEGAPPAPSRLPLEMSARVRESTLLRALPVSAVGSVLYG